MYQEKLSLKDRVAVVTGGGRNIGLACAEALAEAGASIVVAELSEELGEEAAEGLRDKGYKAEFRKLDVTDPKAVDACADDVQSAHGRVDILVANAGIATHYPSEEMTDDAWLKVIDINLNGVYWCNRAFGKRMLDAGSGAIVNIGSMSGIIANKPQPQCHYNASKSGVHMLTKSLAAEWGPRGVRVNAVAPTYIETAMTKEALKGKDWYETWMEMTPMGRWGRPDEIASVVHFLASDAASLMTGSIVLADAGYTCW
jgi:NAD(P)-dependent dehydrogenase (short-subunit alcohol dehydrogenase family)